MAKKIKGQGQEQRNKTMVETLYDVHQHPLCDATFLYGQHGFPGYYNLILPDSALMLFVVLWEGNFVGKEKQTLQHVS